MTHLNIEPDRWDGVHGMPASQHYSKKKKKKKRGICFLAVPIAKPRTHTTGQAQGKANKSNKSKRRQFMFHCKVRSSGGVRT